VRKWDGKKFYGRFQYKKVKATAVLTSGFTVRSDVAALFRAEVYGAERQFPWLADYLRRSPEPLARKRFPALLSLFEPPATLTFLPDPVPLPADNPPPDAKNAPRPPDPAPFSPGDHVLPVSGRFASLPCRVDSAGDYIVASVLQGTLFEVDQSRLRVIEKPQAPVRPPLADIGVQAAGCENSLKSVREMKHDAPLSPPCEQASRETQTKSKFQPVPRVGDLVGLWTGNHAIVLRGGLCRDVLGRDFPMTTVTHSQRIEDDPTTRDSAGNRVNIGEVVKIVKGKDANKEGEVLHMIDHTYFIAYRDDVIAVAASQTLLTADTDVQADIVDEEVVTIRKAAISAPYRIVAMATDGTLRAVQGEDAITLKLAEYGSAWMFAAEVGLSSGKGIQKPARKP
jgi:ribosomal protein L24